MPKIPSHPQWQMPRPSNDIVLFSADGSGLSWSPGIVAKIGDMTINIWSTQSRMMHEGVIHEGDPRLNSNPLLGTRKGTWKESVYATRLHDVEEALVLLQLRVEEIAKGR